LRAAPLQNGFAGKRTIPRTSSFAAISHSAFRYITVDAYLSAVPFYEKNVFVHLTKKDEDEHTRLMFYDMMEM
jgi:hypothetical protein